MIPSISSLTKSLQLGDSVPAAGFARSDVRDARFRERAESTKLGKWGIWLLH